MGQIRALKSASILCDRESHNADLVISVEVSADIPCLDWGGDVGEKAE